MAKLPEFKSMSLSARCAWIGLPVSFGVIGVTMLKPTVPAMDHVLQVGVPNLIGWPSDPGNVMELFEKYGAEGRKVLAAGYLDFWSDTTFAVCYSISMALGIYALQPQRRWLCGIALSGGLCNLGENFSIIRLCNTYPDLDEAALMLGPKFAQAKLWTVVTSLSVILVSGYFHCCGKNKAV